MTVAVLTPSLPERAELLAECLASVAAQTYPPDAHFVGVDHARAGCVPTMNRLMESVYELGVEWVALLADDDLFYPEHLETLIGASEGADIVYSWCDVEGRDWNPNRSFDADALRASNYIPSTSLIRMSVVADLDGWDEGENGWEDWDFWLRALDAGAVFRCVEKVTWRYRFGSWGNISWGATSVNTRSSRSELLREA